MSEIENGLTVPAQHRNLPVESAKLLLDFSSDPLLLIEQETVWVNAAASELLGLPFRKATQSTLSKLSERLKAEADLSELLRGSSLVVSRLRLKDGREITLTPVTSESGITLVRLKPVRREGSRPPLPASLPLATVHAHCEMVYASDGWLAFTGRERQAELGRGWLENISPEERVGCEAAIERSIATTSSVSIETLLGRNGTDYQWAILSAYPEVTASGTVAHVTLVDIGQRKQREQRIRDVNRKLRTRAERKDEVLQDTQRSLDLAHLHLSGVLEGMRDPVAALDNELGFIAFNRAYANELEKLYGVTLRAGMRLADVITDTSDLTKLTESWKRAVAGEEFSGIHALGTRREDQEFYEFTYSSLRSASGELMGATQVVRNVTDKVRAQEQVNRLNLELEERVHRRTEELNALVANAPVCFALFDTSLSFLRINRTMAAYSGKAPTEHIGRGIESFAPELKEEGNRVLNRIIESGRSVEEVELSFHPASCPERPHYFLIAAYPVKGIGGTVKQIGFIAIDITDRKEAEHELEASEKRYRQLLHAGRDAVLIHALESDGTTSNFIEVNDEACRRYGFTRKEMLEMNVSALTGGSEEQTKAHMEALMQRGELSLQSRHRTSTGRWLDMEVSASLHDVDGRRYVMSICRDISDRLRFQKALEESQKLFQRMAEASPDLLYVYDLENHINVYANRELPRVLGYSTEDMRELGSDPLYKLIHPEDLALLKEHHTDFQNVDEGSVLELELRVRRSDGTWRWLRCRDTVFLRNLEGKPLQIVGIAQDITERKKQDEALRESEERFRSSFENSAVGMAYVGLDGGWIRVNDTLCGILGYDRDELLDCTFQSVTHPDDLAEETNLVSIMVEGELDHHRFEKRYLRKNKQVIWARVSVSLQRNAAGEPAYFHWIIQDITSRKAAEQELLDSETRHRALFDDSPLGIVMVDPVTFEFAHFNRQAHEVLGYSREEFAGLTLTEIQGGRDANELKDAAKVLLASDQVHQFETKYRCKNGGTIDVLITGRSLKVGNTTYLMGTFQDITDRKRAETDRLKLLNDLSEANALLDNLIDNAPVGIGFWDNKMRWMRLNDALAEINGIPREEHLGKTVSELLPQVPGDVTSAFRHVLLAGDVVRHSVSGETPASPGLKRYWDVVYYPVRVQGEIVGVGAICEEVSDRRRAQEAILRANERIRSILESIRDGFMSISRDFRLSYVNHTAAELLQKRTFELQGALIWDIFPMADASVFSERFQRAMTSGSAEHFEGYFEPSEQWFDVRCYPSMEGLSVFFADITERKRAEETLRRAKEAAEAANRAKSAFLASMSHDIRTPLTSILGFAELLSERVGPEEREHAEAIQKGGERLMETLNSVLALARLEGRQINLKPALVNVGAELRAMVQLMQEQAIKRGLYLKIEQPQEQVFIDVDRSGLNRALMNLVGNALKFTHKGGATLGLYVREGMVDISVTDTGPGIDPDFLPKVFDAFERGTDGSANAPEGSGLGLAITRQIVELMGGRIKVVSQPDHGTIFTMTFPIAKREQNLREEVTQVQEQEANPPVRQRMLIVEDYQNIRTILNVMLKDRYDLAMASTVNEALEVAARTEANVALLDINIEERNSGIELLQKLRKMDAYQNIPIIAFTAYAMPEDQERFLKAGFDACLAKPFTRQSLETALKTALEKGRQPKVS